MNISELLNANANITISVSLDDLRTFATELIKMAKDELEAEVIAKQNEIYLTRLETCEFLKVDQSTLFRWARRGYLMPVEVGGRRVYKKSDLKRILNGESKPISSSEYREKQDKFNY